MTHTKMAVSQKNAIKYKISQINTFILTYLNINNIIGGLKEVLKEAGPDGNDETNYNCKE